MVRIQVESPNVKYTTDLIEAQYAYHTTHVRKDGNVLQIQPQTTQMTFRTEKHVPKLGLMLVGWGGNNGSTLTAAILANKQGISWMTKDGPKRSNYFGSITQSSTVFLGTTGNGEDVFVPMRDMLPMVEPNDIVVDGWDISGLNLGKAMERAKVLDYDLQKQLMYDMNNLKPRPSAFDGDFIAANQEDRADNVIPGDKFAQLNQIREDIRDFKRKSGVDKVIVLWTANTERFCDVKEGFNDTSTNLLRSIRSNEAEISPSTIFAVASILEGCAYLNGSPQNTFVPGCVQLAEEKNVFIGGDDFKSGQTKFKSVIVDFLVNAGLKPTAIVSYNHLGNNDGKNLSAPAQFRSKEISKSNVVDDMVRQAQGVLYEGEEKPDHCVVIKYVPHVGDSKRAMDEYTSEIMMGGQSTISVHNVCEDSLLAAPIILDLAILTELAQRITFKVKDNAFQNFNSVLSILGYLCKAPLVPAGTPLVNALFRQRSCIENIMRACLGLAPINHMGLEHKLSRPKEWPNKARQDKTSVVCNGIATNGYSNGTLTNGRGNDH